MGPATFLGLCLLGCLVLHPTLPGAEATKCPRGWLSFGGHCYGYFGQGLSWRKAEAWCQATRGGHLASLHSPEEHRALAAFIAQRPRREDEDDSVWIGLHQRRQSWLWADGSPRRYWAWEGDDGPGPGPVGQPCAALEDSAGFMAWEGESCVERKPFVCKYAA
ncbi:dromaiocalcin-1-like [Corapipo altera]|uniref:dromaiocalcin-1-like n=1 Tax=Corapipo altera TaxID=415028 RepID=UPI000FD63DF9|nr:dromaiocalcin-1-like [Corapipo altera]